jgi:serine/threonine protein kinase
MVFDCTIQLVTAMDFAHNNKLIHGQLDLSKIKISEGPLAKEDEKDGIEKPRSPYYNLEFEVTDFAPVGAMKIPLEPEATYWPFSKNKDPKKLTNEEKMEVLMLKDIYAIGVCILEMMIGRFDRLKYNIDIDNIPAEWGNLPESSTLIKVLVECIQLDSISKRQGKLSEIRKLLIQDFKKHFNKNYRMEKPFVGKKADMLNKRACVAFFNKEFEKAQKLWSEAVNNSDQHFYSCFNMGMKQFLNAEITSDQLLADFSDDVFEHQQKGEFVKAILQVANGKRVEGSQLLDNYIQHIC